jgi:hypothetical protein
MFKFVLSLRTTFPGMPIPSAIREKAREMLAPVLGAFEGARVVPNTAEEIVVVEFTRDAAKEVFIDAIRLQTILEDHNWEFGKLFALKTYIETEGGNTLAFINPRGNLLEEMVARLVIASRVVRDTQINPPPPHPS